ncbi:MAG: PAS domain S-box protein, partial [Candidatus Omnitrophica bacterium]|nr:PAS domain S-box protein [Candidatus Omnitrophota bacterium]
MPFVQRDKKNKKFRLPLMAVLLLICVGLTYLFRYSLGTNVIFSHFYYLPAILAALWWHKRGVVVALFLSTVLIATGFMAHEEIFVIGDYLRSFILIVVAVVVGTLSHGKQKAEHRIDKSERRYQLLAENITDVIWVVDLNVRFIYISPSIYNLTGYKAEELIGKSARCVLASDSYKKAAALIKEEIKRYNKLPSDRNLFYQTVELEHLKKSGGSLWAEVKASFFHDEEGELIGVVGTTRDITERKAVEDKIKKAYQMTWDILEKSPFGIYIVNNTGGIDYVNPAMVGISGDSYE